MGNSPSRYDDTDWNKATGGLTSASETIDGAEPTSAKMQLFLSPSRPNVPVPLVMGQLPLIPVTREYQIKDGDSNVIFSTKKVDKLVNGFDLVREVNNNDDDDDEGATTILRVDSTYSNRTWHIFQVGTPVFEGQRPDPEPSSKTGQDLFRKASVFYPKGEQHSAVVHMFRNNNNDDDDDVDAVLKLERCGGGVKWAFQTMRFVEEEDGTQQSPLVAYCKWEGSPVPMVTKEEHMVMHLARGSDLALHVILAVLANLERSSWKAEYTG
jgi:hypothetical protein